MPFDFVTDITFENGLPSTSALNSATAHLHTSMQGDTTHTDVCVTDSDKSYRPDKDNNSEHQSHRPELNTRVDMQSVQQDTTSVAKVPVIIPGVVDSENTTCQDSRCKGFSNHSDYW